MELWGTKNRAQPLGRFGNGAADGDFLRGLRREKKIIKQVSNEKRWLLLLNVGGVVLFLQLVRQYNPYHTLAVLAVFMVAIFPKTILGKLARTWFFRRTGRLC